MVTWAVLIALAIIVANMGVLMITDSLLLGRVLVIVSVACLVFIIVSCVVGVIGALGL